MRGEGFFIYHQQRKGQKCLQQKLAMELQSGLETQKVGD